MIKILNENNKYIKQNAITSETGMQLITPQIPGPLDH